VQNPPPFSLSCFETLSKIMRNGDLPSLPGQTKNFCGGSLEETMRKFLKTVRFFLENS
jgi:hypothetical protein